MSLHNTTSHKPSRELKQAATTLARQLRKAYAPGETATYVAKSAPPGVLQVREVIRSHARQTMTGVPDLRARPFRHKRIDRTYAGQLKVAFMGDISGSMSALSAPLGDTRWVVTNAAEQVNGEVAAALFGQWCYPIQRPGKRQPNVRYYAANEGEECPATALSFIDDNMRLSHSDGPRVVVIFSDFNFVNNNEAAGFAYLHDHLARQGVSFVAVTPSPDNADNAVQYGIDTTVALVKYPDVVRLADNIGQQIIRAVSRSKH